MNKPDNMSQQPSPSFQPVSNPVKKPSLLKRIPVIAQVTGVLSLFILMAGLLTVNQLSQTSQDLSSRAVAGPATLQLKIEPATMSATLNDEKEFKVVVNTQQQRMSAAKLILNYSNDLVDISLATGSATDFPVILKPFSTNWFSSSTSIKAGVVVGANPNNPVLKANGTVATFKIKPKRVGTAEISLDDTNTEAAHFNFDSDASTSSGKLVLVITDPPAPPTICWNYVQTESGTQRLIWPDSCKGTPKTTNPTCQPTITPLTDAEKTQYDAWKQAGSRVPTACGGTVTDPELTLKFQIQGTLKAGVNETGELIVRYPDQQDTTKKVKKTYSFTMTSGANGIFTTQPIKLTGLPEPLNGEMELFVKTPTTLRKKLGVIGKYSFDRTTNKLTKDYSQAVLFVGDFDRTEGQENFFRMLDVSQMLSQYRAITNPVTPQNAQFDVDRNNIINILDVSIITGNYDRIVREGENP